MGRPEVDGPNSGYAALLARAVPRQPGSVPEEWRDALRERSRRPCSRRSPASRGCSSSRANGIPRRAPAAAPPGARSRSGARTGAAAAPDQELLGGVAAAMALVKAIRMHGHLDARLDPLGSEPPGDPALEPLRLIPPLTPELQARIPASLLRLHVEGETLADALPRLLATYYCGTIALRDRAHLRPRGARLAAAGDRVGPLPAPLTRDERVAAARPAEPGRGDGALPPPRVPRPEAVLARGPRRDDPDARRGDRARRRRRRARGRDRDGAPRPAQRPRAHRRPAVRRRSCASSRASGRSRRSSSSERGRHRRRQVPPRRRRARARRTPARSRSRSPPTRATSRPSTPSSRAARAPSRPTAPRATATHDPTRRAADPHPRRRGVRRPGDRRGDVQPRGARRLLAPAARST